MTEGGKKTKSPDPYAAIRRAVQTAGELTAEDRATVISRLETGEPEMGLAGMARVEEIAAKLDGDQRVLLVKELKKIGAAPAGG